MQTRYRAITARAADGSGKKATISIKIVNAVKALAIDGPADVASGCSVTYKAVITPENATNDDVIWSVDCDSSIATISSSGKLRAKSGITMPLTIAVTCVSEENPAIFATRLITIRPAVEKIQIIAPQTFIDLASEDPTLQLEAVCLPDLASQEVTWSSSSENRATVDENGLVTAKKTGSVTITAKAADGSGKSAKITLNIVNAVKDLTITGATELAGGANTRLTAVILPENATNQNVVWSLDCDKSIATISSSGRFYAKSVTEPVTVTVFCFSKENNAVYDTHQITIRPSVGRITIIGPRLWIDVNSANPTLQLTAICTPDSAAQSVTWSSSSKSVATVNAYGLVTAHRVGSATITARANDGSGRYTSVTIRVVKPITEITIAGDNAVRSGRTLRLRYAITPADATNKRLVWSVNCSSSIATVTNGVVSAKKVTAPTLIVVTAASADDPSVNAQFPVVILP